MIKREKIKWRKPDYENEWGRVSADEINNMCLSSQAYSTGDVIIKRSKEGRRSRFVVYRVEKVGELIGGINTLTREQAIFELKSLMKKYGVKNEQ